MTIRRGELKLPYPKPRQSLRPPSEDGEDEWGEEAEGLDVATPVVAVTTPVENGMSDGANAEEGEDEAVEEGGKGEEGDAEREALRQRMAKLAEAGGPVLACPSGDTTPCRMAGVTFHTGLYPHSGHPTRGCIPKGSSPHRG